MMTIEQIKATAEAVCAAKMPGSTVEVQTTETGLLVTVTRDVVTARQRLLSWHPSESLVTEAVDVCAMLIARKVKGEG